MLKKILACLSLALGLSLGSQNANAAAIVTSTTNMTVGQLVAFDLFGDLSNFLGFSSAFSYTSNLTLLSPLNATCDPDSTVNPLYCGPNPAIPGAAGSDAWTANSLVFSSNGTVTATNAFIARLLFQANTPGLAQIGWYGFIYNYDTVNSQIVTVPFGSQQAPLLSDVVTINEVTPPPPDGEDIPEPAAMLLFGTGLALTGVTARRRRKR